MMMMWILTCPSPFPSPFPSVPPRIFSTLFFEAYTINWVILLIVLYDRIMLWVWMSWYTDDSVTTIHFMSLSVVYCMSGAIYNILSNGNHTNDNNTTVPSSSLLVDATVAVTTTNNHLRWYCYQYCMLGATNYVLSDGNDTNDYNTTTPSSSLLASTAATAVVVVYPRVRHKYSTWSVYGTTIHNKYPSSSSLCIPVLSDWVPVYIFFPFIRSFFILDLVGPFNFSL